MSTIAQARRIGAAERAAANPVARALTHSVLGRGTAGIAFASAVGAVFALPMMTAANWRTPLMTSLAQWWAWGLVTPLIVWADRKLPFSPRQLGRRAAAHGLAGLLFTALYLYVFTAMRALVGVTPWSTLRHGHMFAMGMDILGWFLWSTLIYWVIVGALQAWRYYERYLGSELRAERLEKSYSQARLNALRMQLDPHFLFNALNTISSHVERDPRLTRSMIEHLGDLLRMSLESKDRQEVPLAEELAFLDHYLEIQRIRFGEQLEVAIDVEPNVRYASVPSLFLQPLVENAIRHGISRRASGGLVTVRARGVDGHLAISVTDDGVGLPPAWTLENCAGLGLSVTRERLAGLYPDGEGKLALRRRSEGGTAVDILLPLRVMGEDDERA